MSGPEIYMWRINHGYADGNTRILNVSDKFGSMQNFNGLSIMIENTGKEDKLCYAIGWTMRKKVTDATYTYDYGSSTPEVERTETVKMSTNMYFFSFGYRPGFANSKFQIGLSMDMGFLKTRIKTKDPNSPGSKWQPWFYTQKVLSNGITGNTPIAAWGIYASYDLGPLCIRLTHIRPVLDGNLNSQTFKYTNLPSSNKVFPIGNTMISALYSLNL